MPQIVLLFQWMNNSLITGGYMNHLTDLAKPIYKKLPQNMKAAIASGLIPTEADRELKLLAENFGIKFTPKDSALAFMDCCNLYGPKMRV